MPKTVTRLTDNEGNVYKWTFWHETATNCTSGQKPRRIAGWSFRDHEGYTRFCEGNWTDFVPYLRMVAENYGFKTTLS